MSLHVSQLPSFTISRNMRSLRERLGHVSSGRRVNRAADDAAGLATADQLCAVARSKRAAVRNIEQALSLLDTADAGMSHVVDHLVRLRELATQAASEVLGDTAREALQQEFTGTLNSIDHAAASTSWETTPLLSYESVDVGLIVDVSGSMSGEIAATQSAIEAFRQTFLDAGLNVGLGLAVMGVDTTDGVTQRADIGTAEFVTELASLGIEMYGPMSPYAALLNASGAEDLPGDDDPDAFTWRANPLRRVLVLITDTGQELALTGHSQSQVASMLAARDVEVHTINPSGHNSAFNTITSGTGGQTWNIGDGSGSGIATALESIAADLGSELGTSTSLQVQVSHSNEESSRIDLELPMDATANGLQLSGTTIGTVEDARAALDAVDNAMNLLGQARSTVGANTNRLEIALQNELRGVENTEAAASRILDADLAAETALLVRDQILFDVSVSMAAQARKLERDALESILENQ
jgi:flagellin